MTSRVCPHCGNEKIRFESHGSYRFRCDCLVWREYMRTLAHARRMEARCPARPRPEPEAVPETRMETVPA